MRNENPHVPDEVIDRFCKYSRGSSMAQPSILTQLQQAHLPALLWLFDNDRYRAQGRSTLLAYVAITLAMQGELVYLEDLTLTRKMTRESRSHFTGVVLRMLDEHFKGHRFDYDAQGGTLRYKGRHPR